MRPQRLALMLLAVAGAFAVAVNVLSWLEHRQYPHLFVSQRVVQFGTVEVGGPPEAPAGVRLWVRNVGHVTIHGEGIEPKLDDAAVVCPPSFGLAGQNVDCGFVVWDGAPIDRNEPSCDVVKPGASCAVPIAFQPRTSRPYTARFCLYFSTAGQSWREAKTCIRLEGTGSPPPWRDRDGYATA